MKLCFACLGKAGHRLNDCKFAKICGIDKCTRKHHRLLHSTVAQSVSKFDEKSKAHKSEEKQEKQDQKKDDDKTKSSTSGTNMSLGSRSPSIFMIVPISVYANGKKIDTHAFIDYGSAFTLIESDLAEQLSLTGTPEPLSMICAKGTVVQETNSIRSRVFPIGRRPDFQSSF